MTRKRQTNPNKGYPKRLLNKYGPPQTKLGAPVTELPPMNNDPQSPDSAPSAAVVPTKVAAPPAGDEGARTETEQGRQKRTEKRAEPQTVAEFVEAFYAGRAKVLSEATVRRLKVTAVVLDSAARGDLMRMAIATDESLDKTRRLLLLATEVDELKALGRLLLEFAAETVLLHPAVRTNGLRAHLFPVYGDEHTLEDAWRLLEALEKPTPAIEELADESPGADNRGVGQEPGGGDASSPAGQRTKNSKAASAARAAQQTAGKARRNALLCSVVWRVYRNQQSFADAMRGLRGTLFAIDSKPTSLEAELLEALALMPEKEDSKVALLLEWTARQQSDLLNKLTDALRRADALAAQGETLDAQLQGACSQVEALEQQLQSERASKEALDHHIGVVKTHGQADYEELRASSLRAIRDTVQQLEQVSVALGRDVPKVSFAREVLDAIVDSLRATTKKLEGA